MTNKTTEEILKSWVLSLKSSESPYIKEYFGEDLKQLKADKPSVTISCTEEVQYNTYVYCE
jgi:hypothetical protein